MAITKNPGIYDDTTRTYSPGPEVVTHVGRVLDVYNKDHRAMSDVYVYATFATVINDDGSLDSVLVNANFECDVNHGRAEVDATDEMRLVQACYAERQAELAAQKELARQANEAEIERQRARVGKQMVVTRGGQKGVTGTVAFIKGAKALLKPDAAWQDRKADGTWHLCSSLGLRA